MDTTEEVKENVDIDESKKMGQNASVEKNLEASEQMEDDTEDMIVEAEDDELDIDEFLDSNKILTEEKTSNENQIVMESANKAAEQTIQEVAEKVSDKCLKGISMETEEKPKQSENEEEKESKQSEIKNDSKPKSPEIQIIPESLEDPIHTDAQFDVLNESMETTDDDESGKLIIAAEDPETEEEKSQELVQPLESKLASKLSLTERILSKGKLGKSPNRIVKAYKRRAYLKNMNDMKWNSLNALPPTGNLVGSSSVPKVIQDQIATYNATRPVPSTSSAIDGKLMKCGTTIKKLTPPADEPMIKFGGHSSFQSDPLHAKSIQHYPSIDKNKLKIVRLPNSAQTSKSTGYFNLCPKVLKRVSPPKIKFTINEAGIPVRVDTIKKDAKPKLANPKPKKDWLPVPPTIRYPKAMKPPKEPVKVPQAIIYPSKPATVKPTIPPLRELYDAEDASGSAPALVEEASPSIGSHVKIVKLPTPATQEKPPEPIKYVIPQDLLMSPTNDRIKKVKRNILRFGQPGTSKTTNGGELFVVDEIEEEKKLPEPVAKQSMSRRKSILIPKPTDDDILFDEPLYHMATRPQANVDLMNNLARYRVIVKSMLARLNMPEIDLSNENGDDYINLYKIYRKS
jgi:hypothetical protein